MMETRWTKTITIFLGYIIISPAFSSEIITTHVFEHVSYGIPAAFGDFNSDRLTDIFVLQNNRRTLQLFLANIETPLLRPANPTCSFINIITSIVPGDFNGDVFMDVLVTTLDNDYLTNVYIIWGNTNKTLNCFDIIESKPLIIMKGQPLAIDYNGDMIIDLFGTDDKDRLTFWIFDETNNKPKIIQNVIDSNNNFPIKNPHSNAFLDFNGDYYSDLIITKKDHFEIWNGEKNGFNFFKKEYWPKFEHIGQAIYLDVELKGEMDLIVPVCFDKDCYNSSIIIYKNGYHDIEIDFKNDTDSGDVWGFVLPDAKKNFFTETITLRGGDFNLDGYPDLLAILKSQNSSKMQSFLLQNEECTTCGKFTRTFEIKWKYFNDFSSHTVMSMFYDFYQDGILDVILLQYNESTYEYRMEVLKNSLDYDATFITAMVLSGLTHKVNLEPDIRSLGKIGTNLPGPSISYTLESSNGNERKAIAAQLPQSAYFSLHLPYTTFGLGRTLNFVDTLVVGISGKDQEWNQIPPNMHMVVIPNPIDDPSEWKIRQFLRPSKIIKQSVIALFVICCVLSLIIIGLYYKERRDDRLEKLREAHFFHFDAM